MKGFHLQRDTEYCLSLRFYGYNHRVTSTSVWYTHYKSGQPSGLLWEIDIDSDELVRCCSVSSCSVFLEFIEFVGFKIMSIKDYILF